MRRVLCAAVGLCLLGASGSNALTVSAAQFNKQPNTLLHKGALTRPGASHSTRSYRSAKSGSLADAPLADVVVLHPNAAQCYREQVAAIHRALETGQPFAAEATPIIRSLIDHIVVEPRATGAPVQLTVHGDLAALLQRRDQQGVSVSMVAGPGLEPGTYGL